MGSLDLSPSEWRQIVSIRETIHSHPELAFQEFNTSACIQSALAAAEIPFTIVAGTGIVATIDSGRPGPVVGIRGDMDALPIHEDVALPFRSQCDGVMHACGHDVHTAWTLAAGLMVKKRLARGKIKLIFQPAEEIVQGARALLESGELADLDFIFGGHVDRNFPIGTVVCQSGVLSAASDRFQVVISGQSAHAARPHQGVDTIVAASQWVTAIQSIVSRSIHPSDPVVITVGSIHGGVAANILAGSTELLGTMRTVDSRTRRRCMERIAAITAGIDEMFGTSSRIEWIPGVPAINNTEPIIEHATAAISADLGPEVIRPLGPLNLASEDFAVYLTQIPGAFFRVGACEPSAVPIPAHSPQFYVAHEAIPFGAKVLACVALHQAHL